MSKCLSFCVLGILLLGGGSRVASAQSIASSDALDDRVDSSEWARRLGSIDPIARQRAAEALALLAAVDQKKLVEGYYLQEKNRRVRLALEWALYRMGKSEMLFPVVRDLDSSRHLQAVTYLIQLDGPQPLYLFMRHEDNPPKVIVGLLETLAQLGDAATLEQIKPFLHHYDPKVAKAAEFASRAITDRLSKPPQTLPTRPRKVGSPEGRRMKAEGGRMKAEG